MSKGFKSLTYFFMPNNDRDLELPTQGNFLYKKGNLNLFYIL